MKCISPVLSDTMAGWLAGWLGGKRKSKGNLYLFLTFEQAVVEWAFWLKGRESAEVVTETQQRERYTTEP